MELAASLFRSRWLEERGVYCSPDTLPLFHISQPPTIKCGWKHGFQWPMDCAKKWYDMHCFLAQALRKPHAEMVGHPSALDSEQSCLLTHDGHTAQRRDQCLFQCVSTGFLFRWFNWRDVSAGFTERCEQVEKPNKRFWDTQRWEMEKPWPPLGLKEQGGDNCVIGAPGAAWAIELKPGEEIFILPELQCRRKESTGNKHPEVLNIVPPLGTQPGAMEHLAWVTEFISLHFKGHSKGQRMEQGR